MVHYLLPKLSFGYDELEPYFDKETMEIHHLKHHQAYVDGLNTSLAEIGATSHPKYISAILSELHSLPESGRQSINFFGGGYENHRLFWETLTAKSDKIPGGKLEDQIDVYFNNFENFKKIFTQQAISIQGSGWCWLVFNETYHKIEIITTPNQDSPWTLQKTPLLGLDMWEHAYYLNYQNKRPDYVESWWNVINWDYVTNRFEEIF